MATVISAPIRTGKTLLCMSIIDKASKKEPHRRIYTNIVGCSYPGVIAIQSTSDKPFDWRDLPNGSILIYDEAHEHPAFSKDDLLKTYEIDDSEYLKAVATINSNPDLRVRDRDELIKNEKEKQKLRLIKAKEDILDIGRSLTLHGHFGIDIYFVTQKTYKLNDSVKAGTNEHLILRRLFKLKACTIYSFAELQEQFGRNTMKNALSWRFWWYPKQLYKFYVSAEEHESSSKIPLSLIFWCCLPILIILLALQKSSGTKYWDYFFGSDEVQAKEISQPVPDNLNTPNPNFSAENQLLVNISKCIDQFNLTEQQCREMYDPSVLQARNQELESSTRNNMQQVVFDYDPNRPYDVNMQANYQPTDFPRFKNAIVWNGKCTPYSQQGTVMHGVSSADCFRLASGDRPFDYFSNQQNVQNTQVQQIVQPSQESKAPDAESIAKHEEAKRLGLI